MAEEKDKPKAEDDARPKAEQALIDEACKAWGVDKKYLFAAGIDAATGEAVIVTNGGMKRRWKKGDKPQPLSEIEVTGVNPEWDRRKPITGGKKQ